MKALNILKNLTKEDITFKKICKINEAIKELEAYITNYQGIKRRLDNTVTTLAVLQNENKALIKILTQINEEILKTKLQK